MSRRVLVATVALLVAVGACGDDGDPVTTEDDGDDITFAISNEATEQEVEQLTEILENRLEALGIGEATVTVDGDELHVDLGDAADIDVDGIGDVLGTLAELRFRPVLLSMPGGADAPSDVEVTPPEDDTAEDVVVLEGLPEDEALYQLGPSQATGSVVEDADAQLDPSSGNWSVALTFTPEGIEQFNEIAAQCSPPSESCPTGQLALVLDSVVQSAPTVQSASFERDAIVISGDFTEDEATKLALVLRYGSLPAALTPVP